MSATTMPKRTGWPKATLIYYVLATLDVIAIVAGLFLSHQIMQVLGTVVTTSSTYERQFVSVRNLTDATTDAQAIAVDGMRGGNMSILKDAFLTKTGDARAEMDRIRHYAADSFPPAAHARFTRILGRLEKALNSLEQHALAAFDYQAAGNSEAALTELKQMQQRYTTLRPDIRDINQLSALQRNGSLEKYRRSITQLRGYEFMIGGLIIFIICGVLFYGHFISGLMRRKYAELQAAYEASFKAESEARQFSDRLQVVNEDIIRLNQDLRTNLVKLQDAQDESMRKSKMAQLGQLTATVAHELRNPLGAVRTSTFLLERKIKGKGLGVEPQIERITNGITRCDNIISQLLDFARTKALQNETLEFDNWLAKLLEEEAQKLPSAVAVDCELGLGTLAVPFDPARMSRVVINLLSNASEAMVGKGDDPAKFAVKSPRISVTTRTSERGVELTIADNGPGISAEQQGKIFEPLFTTKNFGTGLGLPAVQKTLEQHGGGIEVQSEPGQGARFIAWWPLQPSEKEAA